MKKISYWAKENPWPSRLIIVIIYILITGTALLMGRNLQVLNIHIGSFLLFSAAFFFVGGAIFYPVGKHGKHFRFTFYFHRKLCDWMLAFSAFLAFGFIGNTGSNPFLFSGTLKGTSIASAPSGYDAVSAAVSTGKNAKIKIKPTKAERKAILKELKMILRQSLHDNNEKDLNKGTRIALVALSIVGGVVLSILLAGLSCSIACSGAESLAVVVAVFGAAAIATLLILTIRAIFRRYPKVFVPDSKNESVKSI